MSAPIKVTVSDPTTGEVLGEQIIKDDYMVICAGSRYVANTQAYPTKGTHVVTIKRGDR
jgi:hypothetical protein